MLAHGALPPGIRPDIGSLLHKAARAVREPFEVRLEEQRTAAIIAVHEHDRLVHGRPPRCGQLDTLFVANAPFA